MLSTLYTAASGMVAQQQAIDVVANNLANMATPGYRAQRPVFADIVSGGGGDTVQAAAGAPGIGRGVQLAGVVLDSSQGSLLETRRNQDLAISGNGYFAVAGPGQQVGYTRGGTFELTADGRLATSEGWLLRGKTGTIQLPKGATGFTVKGGGAVVATMPDGTSRNIGTLQLAQFDNQQALSPGGGGVLLANAGSGNPRLSAPGAGGAGQVLQGFVESANVDLATEMTSMMMAQRSYQLSAKAVQSADELWQMANNLVRR